jgi:serine/threonine-protein kinase
MLTGRLPFVGSDSEVLAQQLLAAPAPPSELVPDLDPRLEAVILTAMRKLPRNRHPSMEDLLVDLRRIHAGTGGVDAAILLEPDVYVPQTPYARTVAAALYKKLNKPIPAWS